MKSAQSFSLLWTPATLVISIVVVVAVAVLCWLSWRRSGYLRSVGMLEALRLVLVIFGAILLNQPEWIETYRPDEQPTIVVLYDDSASMQTRDASLENSASGTVTRAEAIAPLIDPKAWSSLSEEMRVDVEPVDSVEPSEGTDLYSPLATMAERHANLRGVVLFSDGDWNAGQPPVEAAGRLRSTGVPVFTVPVGSETRLPDVEVLSFNVPTFGIANKPVRIPVTIDSSLPRDTTAEVTLTSSEGETISKSIRIAAMQRTSDTFLWKAEAVGDYTLTISLPEQPGETIIENNEQTAPISIREEKLRVLVIESYPRWEYRYLRNALSRDPGVEVSCLLFHPGLDKVGGGNRDYIQAFPEGLDQLAPYDVVFLGDVGLDDGHLTEEQCAQLKGLVEFQASGLVFIPGWQGRQFSLLETELADLYPVVLDPLQPGGWGSRTPNHFELTERGRRSLLTKLADTPEENREVWENLPGFQWYAPVVRAKAGSDVLSVHDSMTNEYGRLPLLATRTYGAGKVLFMGTDGAWRWRKGVEDLYHYRFWGQVVRWMAYQRNMAKGETMRLYYAPEQPQMHQTVSLNANVMEPGGEPLDGGELTARIVAPSGTAQTVHFQSAGDQWGAFAARFVPAEAGTHALTLACKQTGQTLETSIFVQGAALERIGQPARPEVLEEIARVTRGEHLSIDRVKGFQETLRQLPEPPPAVRRVQLWSHPVVAGSFVVMLGGFWVGRKAVGLI